MRTVAFAAAVSLLLAANSASAETALIDVGGSASNTVLTNGTALSNPPLSGQYTSVTGSGASWDSFVTVAPTYVSFESSNAVAGTSVTTISSSSVSLVFSNTGSTSVTPTLSSDIVPAEFGMYLANTGGGCGGNVYTGCGLNSLTTFQQALSGGNFGSGPIATAEFDFKVYDGATLIYNVNGSMALQATGNATALNIRSDFDPNFNQSPLANLQLAYGNPNGNNQSDQSAFIYAWNATPIELQLAALGAGQTRTLTYQTTVTSTSTVGCSLRDSTLCLIAFSGFGDPIGLGAVDFAAAQSSSALSFLAAPTSAVTTLDGGFDGLDFSPVFFSRPTFDPQTGLLGFNLIPGPPSVPEPATWISLIVGFGVLGATLRGRRLRPA